MRPARVSAALALLAAAALLAGGGTWGQDKEKKGDGPAKPTAKGALPKYFDRLDLTEAQRAEVVKLTAEHRQKVENLRDEIRKLDDDYGKKRVAVLTDEQRKKLIDLVAGPPPKDTADPKAKGK
jgi:Spy/CpxP family protein refolding chaperone